MMKWKKCVFFFKLIGEHPSKRRVTRPFMAPRQIETDPAVRCVPAGRFWSHSWTRRGPQTHSGRLDFYYFNVRLVSDKNVSIDSSVTSLQRSEDSDADGGDVRAICCRSEEFVRECLAVSSCTRRALDKCQEISWWTSASHWPWIISSNQRHLLKILLRNSFTAKRFVWWACHQKTVDRAVEELSIDV